jgi:hypothetical protein
MGHLYIIREDMENYYDIKTILTDLGYATILQWV